MSTGDESDEQGRRSRRAAGSDKTDTSRLQGIARAYTESAVLYTAIDVELFTHVRNGADTEEALAAATGLRPIDVDRLVTCALSMDLLRWADDGERLVNAPDTDLYLVPANWPGVRREHWMALLRARAIENQAYVAGVNRVGSGDGLDYTGDSRIIDPLGEILQEAPAGEVVTLRATIDPAVVTDVRTRFRFMADR